ncbi:MAG: flagellar biosynthesis protein FlhF [Phycisphaerales bacterium]|nr:MAG: flagellar biosynthesis protein FlhF [Phycisphaerales bacterium]
MPVKMRTYQAYTMAEALAAVKRDLGADAVILSTRSVQKGGILGIGRKTIVEVTATPGQAQAKPGRPTPKPPSRPGSPLLGNARRAYGQGGAAKSPADMTQNAPQPEHDLEADRERTRRLAQAMLVQHEKKRAEAGAQAEQSSPQASPDTETEWTPRESPTPRREPSTPRESAPRFDTTEMKSAGQEKSEPAVASTSSDSDSIPRSTSGDGTPRRFVLRAVDEDESGGSNKVANGRGTNDKQTSATKSSRREPLPSILGNASGERSGADLDRAMQDELSAIKDMVGQVLQGQSGRNPQPTPKMPAKLFDYYLKLIGQDLSEELADQIINAVRDELSATELDDPDEIRAAVLRHLADDIPVADQAVPVQSPDDRPLTIALVGPTGVGKTTTLAKIAASFKLRHHRKVGLVTSDTYRIAAVDQLRTYANIIGLPLQVVLTPAEMQNAVAALSDCDVILIDTAGRSQNDTGRIDELKAFISAADPHEVHLVLSSTASEKVLLREAEAFGVVGIHKIVLTKLDEAVSFGMLINVIRQLGKELSFVTNGQEVPDHIEVGRPERLASLLLGDAVREAEVASERFEACAGEEV